MVGPLEPTVMPPVAELTTKEPAAVRMLVDGMPQSVADMTAVLPAPIWIVLLVLLDRPFHEDRFFNSILRVAIRMRKELHASRYWLRCTRRHNSRQPRWCQRRPLRSMRQE